MGRKSLQDELRLFIRARELYICGYQNAHSLSKALGVDYLCAKNQLEAVQTDLVEIAENTALEARRQEIDEMLVAELVKIEGHIEICKKTIKVMNIDGKPYKHKAPHTASLASFVKAKLEIFEQRARLWGLVSNADIHIGDKINSGKGGRVIKFAPLDKPKGPNGSKRPVNGKAAGGNGSRSGTHT